MSDHLENVDTHQNKCQIWSPVLAQLGKTGQQAMFGNRQIPRLQWELSCTVRTDAVIAKLILFSLSLSFLFQITAVADLL